MIDFICNSVMIDGRVLSYCPSYQLGGQSWKKN